jgi:chromosome segregation ATPase
MEVKTMSLYNQIGFTRRDAYREKTLIHNDKVKMNSLENELRKLQNERDDIYNNMELSEDEISELAKQIQIKIDELINQISELKYVKVR